MEKCDCCNARLFTAGKALKPSELDELQKNTTQAHYIAGNEVFMQGMYSSNVYYLKKGIVKLSMKGIHKNKIIKIVNSPNYIGLSSSIGSQVFGYSAIALSNCVICITNKETYQKLILQNEYFSFEIIKYLSNNELTQYIKFVNLLQQNLNGRIAACLIDFSKNVYKCNKFCLNRKDLTDITGKSRENISRVISQFAKDGIINLDGNEIEILDLQHLEYISKNG